MERLLLLWDELDDLSAALGHVLGATLGEVATVALPVAAAAAAGIGGWMLVLHAPDAAALLSVSALLSPAASAPIYL
jgi:hypothetical protein